MFEFMQNAFFLLCGIACIAVAVLIVYCVIVAIIRTCRIDRKRGNGNGRNQDRRGNA
jgi:hypothetical protein